MNGKPIAPSVDDVTSFRIARFLLSPAVYAFGLYGAFLLESEADVVIFN